MHSTSLVHCSSVARRWCMEDCHGESTHGRCWAVYLLWGMTRRALWLQALGAVGSLLDNMPFQDDVAVILDQVRCQGLP